MSEPEMTAERAREATDRVVQGSGHPAAEVFTRWRAKGAPEGSQDYETHEGKRFRWWATRALLDGSVMGRVQELTGNQRITDFKIDSRGGVHRGTQWLRVASLP